MIHQTTNTSKKAPEIKKLIINELEISNQNEICNKTNVFFSEIGSFLASKLPKMEEPISEKFQHMPNKLNNSILLKKLLKLKWPR